MPLRLPFRATRPSPLAFGLAAGAIGLAAAIGTLLPPAPGAGITLATTVVAAGLLLSRPSGPYPRPELAVLLEVAGQRLQHVRWFVHMRWVAVVVTWGLILTVGPIADLLPQTAIVLLLLWWLTLAAANLAFQRWARTDADPERQIMVQGATDLVILTGFLNASGGIENPVYFAYFFHVIIAGILLPRRKALRLTLLTALLFLTLALGEYLHVFPHFTNRLFPHEVPETVGHTHGDPVVHASHATIFVLGRSLPFLALLLVSAYLTSLIAERLNTREAQLREAAGSLMLEHQRLERVVESAGVGIMLVEPGLALPWTSRRAARWLEIAPASSGSRCPLYRTEDGCSVCIAEETLRTGEERESERTVRLESGHRRYFRHATAPVLDDGGQAIEVVELLEEITERKALEAEAVHRSKLSALGQMAAGVAHEIGNPLSSLATRLHLLERRPEPEFLRESLVVLRGQIERIGKIVRGVSLFARSRRQEWTVWSVNQLVRDNLEIVGLDRRLRGRKLTVRLAEASPWVRGVKDQLTQVLLNLLLNAAESSPPGAEIVVETSEHEGWVLLRVQDQGSGLTQEARDRLFEPFFSTKAEGTGLGLSISQSLVTAHGGSIEVDSREGHGSTFTVLLPLAERPEA